MAGVARFDPGKGLASATESYARSKAYATSATPNRPRHEYDGLEQAKESQRQANEIMAGVCRDGKVALANFERNGQKASAETLRLVLGSDCL
jgi:hypothetical protein